MDRCQSAKLLCLSEGAERSIMGKKHNRKPKQHCEACSARFFFFPQILSVVPPLHLSRTDCHLAFFVVKSWRVFTGNCI